MPCNTNLILYQSMTSRIPVGMNWNWQLQQIQLRNNCSRHKEFTSGQPIATKAAKASTIRKTNYTIKTIQSIITSINQEAMFNKISGILVQHTVLRLPMYAIFQGFSMSPTTSQRNLTKSVLGYFMRIYASPRTEHIQRIWIIFSQNARLLSNHNH